MLRNPVVRQMSAQLAASGVRCTQPGCDQLATHWAEATFWARTARRPWVHSQAMCAHHAARWAGVHGAEVPV